MLPQKFEEFELRLYLKIKAVTDELKTALCRLYSNNYFVTGRHFLLHRAFDQYCEMNSYETPTVRHNYNTL